MGAFPLGPLQFVGLDTLSHIARGWREERVSTGEIDSKQVEEVPTLEKLVKAGKLGRKSGKGLFDCESCRERARDPVDRFLPFPCPPLT